MPSFPQEVELTTLPQLIQREADYSSALEICKLVLEKKASKMSEKTLREVSEMKEELLIRIERVKGVIRAKLEEILKPILQSKPMPKTESDQLFDEIYVILKGHYEMIQDLASKLAAAPAPNIINNTVNCGGTHGQPAPAAPISTPPTATPRPSEASTGTGRVNIDLSDSKAIEQLTELIRKALGDIDALALRLAEMGVPHTHHIAILTAMLEKTARLRALVQPST